MKINNDALKAFRKELEDCLFSLDDIAKNVVVTTAFIGMQESRKVTPVGQYRKRLGGTLKKGWQKDKYKKVGNAHVSGYSNSIDYALYVNNGHRVVVDGKTVGFVEGQRMLEKGMNLANDNLEGTFQHELAKLKQRSGF